MSKLTLMNVMSMMILTIGGVLFDLDGFYDGCTCCP